MPQFTRFMPLPPGAYRAAVDRVLTGLRSLPAEGEPFREFRNRLKRLEIYSRERLPDIRAFLRVPETDTVLPVGVLGQLRGAADLDQAAQVMAERLFAVNPLLFKSVIDRVRERVNGPSELLKFLDSFAYPGVSVSGPEVRNWLAWAQGLGLLRPVGVGLTLGERGALFLKRVDEIDVDEFLEDDQPEPPLDPPVAAPATSEAGVPGGDAPPRAETRAPGAGAAQASPPEVDGAPRGDDATSAGVRAQEQATPAGTASATGSAGHAGPHVTPASPMRATVLDPDLRGLDLAGAPPARTPTDPVPLEAFSAQAEAALFDADLRGATARWLDVWWRAARGEAPTALWSRIGFGGEAWQEDPESALYRLAVAAALRAEASGHDTARDAAAEGAWRSLDAAGLLDALHQGAGLKGPLNAVDASALLAASLVARRLAEHPDLAGDLERCADADAAEAALHGSLGRGFLSAEAIAWLLGALGRSGVLRLSGLDRRLAEDDRAARDTLFRLGFLGSPYASGVDARVAAAAAARLAVPGAERAEQALRAFAHAAGCAYRCPHAAACEVACRERADRA